MSKINATYSSGYYIAPDVDFRKLEEQQRQEQRGKRRKPGDNAASGDGSDDNVMRQTFAIPFDLICLHCNRRIARGSHVYTNRRATDQRFRDAIRIWELEILCRFCKGKYYLLTDPETPKETGGYICKAGCKRVEGDFFSLNQQNQAAREEWEKSKAEAELNPLAALEKENEAARLLEERNRQIEEEVEQQAGHSDSDLLTMLRNRPRRNAELAASRQEDDDDDNDDNRGSGFDRDGEGDRRKEKTSSADPSSSLPPSAVVGLPPGPLDAMADSAQNGSGNDDADAEDADERSYREFTADMERRWRALERHQRAQERMARESATTPRAVEDSEVERVLARYGGGRRNGASGAVAGDSVASPNSTEELVVAPTASTSPAVGVRVGGAVPRSVSAAPPRNKFLVAPEDDEDDDDVRVGVSSSLPPRSAVGTSAAAAGARAGQSRSALPPSANARAGGSALLRNLLDSDDDDSG